MPEYFASVFESPFGGLIVNFTDLPECVAFADTPERARAAAAQALADHIHHMESIGETVPRPSPYDVIRRDPDNWGCQLIAVAAKAELFVE
jgi:predicted RNase H-like HicB family nuclease